MRHSVRFLSRPVLTILVLFVPALIACGDGGGSPTEPPPVASSITLSPASGALPALGATLQFSAQVRDQYGQVMAGASMTWSTSLPSVATVSPSGLATAVSNGSTTITAVSGSASGTASLVVSQAAASVTVTPANDTLTANQGSVQLTAEVKDQNGHVVSAASVTWSSNNPNSVSVNPATGLATAKEPGIATITATSGGVSGAAVITVLAPPIASVIIHGTFRVKVGDSYTYTATAMLADGTVVVRPVTWSVLEPERAIMTADGVLTPTAPGTVTIVATIDGQDWLVDANAYDWVLLQGDQSLFVFIDSDTQITNQFGTSEYPELVFACNASTGKFFSWVDTEYFVTASGLVAYNFDGGAILTQTWIEFDDFSALGHPGPTNLQTKAFASTMAGARSFGFGFNEFQGSAKVTLFRVTGLSAFLAPLFSECPSNSLVSGVDSQTRQAWGELRGVQRVSPEVSAERELREVVGPQSTSIPTLLPPEARVDSRPATRRR